MKSSDVEIHGKDCTVAAAGALEHSAALIHPNLGVPSRVAIKGRKAIIPAAKIVPSLSTPVEVSLSYKDSIGVSPQLDVMQIGLSNAPTCGYQLARMMLLRGRHELCLRRLEQKFTAGTGHASGTATSTRGYSKVRSYSGGGLYNPGYPVDRILSQL